MVYRSEANEIANKQNFQDLTMTQYPNALDTRTNNTNMRGFVNIGEEAVPDFVMAEYTNALIDAVRAIQRTLGVAPSVYHGATSTERPQLIENFTVAKRLSRIEDGLFDTRYGGQNWTNSNPRPVINNHRHTGTNGQPPRIHLTDEVIGLLRYQNINLSHTTGLTGAQISLSPSNNTKIHEVISDLLSKSQGGTVTGDTIFTGVVKTRTSIDATAVDIVNKGQSTVVSDGGATSGRALSSTDTTAQRNIFRINSEETQHLLFGRYVMGIRIKKNSNRTSSSNILFIDGYNQQERYTEEDIDGDYKTIYFVFEKNQYNKSSNITVTKLSTASNLALIVDSYYITPIHPATLDR